MTLEQRLEMRQKFETVLLSELGSWPIASHFLLRIADRLINIVDQIIGEGQKVRSE